MTDRVPLFPGRVQLTEVAGHLHIYDMVLADGATQAGTPLNKANLLSDSTASLLGLTSAATPNDAFARIKNLIDWQFQKKVGSYTGTGTYGESNQTSLTFYFVPAIVMVVSNDIGFNFSSAGGNEVNFANSFIWFNGVGMSRVGGYGTWFSLDTNAKRLSWYSANATTQLNASGNVYRYIAIG